jgi:hypothetical protein
MLRKVSPRRARAGTSEVHLFIVKNNPKVMERNRRVFPGVTARAAHAAAFARAIAGKAWARPLDGPMAVIESVT